ncbi:hypothetical protein DCAR_0935652 [Daucus carota subsp. sativus]|uniref:Uncharacterized protein n=1 Tax=Daucus carota subsp. sativus TaxID=79200 RepID=A0A175YHF1_DAUCS|nr:hypothetical protein DCAR_0935652 [Daucus carota subsp. sativus]
MDFTWETPDPGYKKINVFCEISEDPLLHEAIVSIGALARDSGGAQLWAALGLLPNLTEEQAIMSGIQSALIHAQKMGWELIHIETSNVEVYDTIRHQEHVFLNDEQLEIYSSFNTIYANHYNGKKMKRVITSVPQRMNSSAAYLAHYGLTKRVVFGEISGSVGDLGYYLARDMGMTLPFPSIEVQTNLGEGEVIDGSPPPKKRKLDEQCCDEMPRQAYRDKGKNKVLEHFSFNENGVFGQKAIRIMDKGKLGCYSSVFDNPEVNMNAAVGKEIYSRDILHHALLGTLKSVIPKLYVSLPSLLGNDVDQLMSVDQVLDLLGFNGDKPSTSKNPV